MTAHRAPSMLAIPTGNRPVSLQRTLGSFARHFDEHHQKIAIVVVHSARNAAEQQRIQDAVAQAGVGARYVGLAEKVALAKELRRATGVDSKVLETALFDRERHAVSTGANRNACLLWSAGRRALHTDDDTVATLHCHPEGGVSSIADDAVVTGDACDYFCPSDGDVTRFAIAATDVRAPVGGLVGALREAWDQHPEASLAFFGLAGDCGWGAPFGFWGEAGLGYLLLPDRALARVASDGRVWREMLARRVLLRCAERTRVSRGASDMTTCIGVDGTAALPPFFPVGRGQDTLFSALSERLGAGPALQVPFAVGHAPLETRSFHPDELLRSAASLDCARAMFAFLEGLPEGADLGAWGRHLEELGRLSPAAFADALRDAHAKRMRRLVAGARARSAMALQLSSEWHDDLEAYCSRVEATLMQPEPPWVVDAGGDDPAASLMRLQSLVGRYGALCVAWPEIWRAAQGLVDGSPSTNAARPRPASTHRASPYQTWLWRAHQLDPDDTAYVVFRVYRGTRAIDAERLECAVRLLLARHDGLRARFATAADGEARVTLASSDAFTLRRDPLATESEIAALREHEAHRPFDLTRELPLAMTLLEGARTWELWVRVHHIVWDGVSESIFWRELETIYDNLAHGRDGLFGLAVLGATYAEVAAAQHALLPGLASAAERHWREVMREPPAELPLSSRVSAGPRTARSHRVRLDLPRHVVDAVKALARERRTTVAAVCLAAWQGLLYRFSGERDVTVAVNVANRWGEAEEGHIGLFMTVLPTRVTVADDLSLAALAVANQRALALGHGPARLPFDRLVATISQGRRRFALFQALFTHLGKTRPPALAGQTLEEMRGDATQSGVDIGLTVEEGDHFLAIVMAGNAGHFDATQIAHMAAAYQSAITSACSTPDAPVVALDWLGGDRATLAAWNATHASYPRDEAMPELLRRRATERPTSVALSHGDTRITYEALFQRADGLARRLRSLGVGRDVPVGVFFDRDPRLLEALLAVWVAGGAYVPLDPSFPPERLAFMIADCAAPVIITRRGLVPELPAHHAAVVCVDDASGEVVAEPTDWKPATADSLAYILYTSGSTGRPKGVEIQHRALVNFLHSMAREPGLAAHDVLLALTTISFDIAALELWLPLLVGARIELGGREEAADGERLMAALARCGATAVQSTPSTWRALFAAGFTGDPRLKAMVGGEGLPADLAARLAEHCGEAWNLYGPTETTVWSAAWRIPRAPALEVRIGKPIANTVVRILDDGLREVPIGVVGEIAIGGDGVAIGYRGQSALTAERFIADPLGGRLYRTGDRGRWTAEGQLECLGRNDDQIKLRGFRMEPGEIEAALLCLPEVLQAAAAVHRTPGSEPRLVAWVVLRDGATLGPVAEVRARLRAWLPEYMVPYHVVSVVELPLTPNGKVDRRALVVAFEPPRETPQLNETPSPDEAAVIAEFEKLLQRKVGLDTDFFESGGDSLSAIRLIGRLAAQHPAAPTTGDLFLHATPRALARFLRQPTRDRRSVGHLVPLRRGGELPTLALLHPIGGQLAAYGPLTVHLGGTMPIFGFLGSSSTSERYGSIEERCARYVDELIAATDGPVAVAGYSLGGVLAMQCALELRRRGRAVSLVALFDTWVPRPPRKLAEKLKFRAAELRRFTWSERAQWARVQLMQRLGPHDDPVDEDLELLDWAASEQLGQQAIAWRPARFDGDVFLFRGNRDVRGYSVRPGGLGWEGYCSRLRVVNLDCDHTQVMRDPQAGLIAAAMVRALTAVK